MIKAIIFDCFGVLTADSWHEFRLSLPAELQAQASNLNQQYCRAELSKPAFLAAISKLTGYSQTTVKQVIDNESDKNEPLLQYIAELKPTFKIGLLSNVASNWIRDRFLTDQERQLFDTFIFSFEVGLTKPDPRIFTLAAERLQLKKQECLMVDDLERYCQAAKDAGLAAIQYQNFNQFRSALETLINDPER